MKNLTKCVQNANALHKMWFRGDTLILGVSGGRDSMGLLDVFARIANKESLTIIVAHVNYGLRGNASARDQRLVESAAKKHDLLCEVLVVSSKNRGKNENDWREIRRSHFSRLMQEHNAQSAVLAHTMNDHAETLLLSLLRGAGFNGLANMTQIDQHDDLTIIRPFLSIKRDDITAHCKEFSVRFFNDATNTDNAFTRNRIRNRLIPYLARNFNPQIISTLSQTARIIGQELKDVGAIDPFWAADLSSSPSVITFTKGDLVGLPISHQRQVFRLMITQLTKGSVKISFGLTEQLRKATLSDKSKSQFITAKGLILTRSGATVKITHSA